MLSAKPVSLQKLPNIRFVALFIAGMIGQGRIFKSIHEGHVKGMLRFLLVFVWAPTVVLSMVIWPDLVHNETRLRLPKPTSWKEKNLGQWCRNFTVNQHTQCSEASPFHQYNCCGVHNTDCCFAIQGWVILLGSLGAFIACVSFLFYVLLKFQIICPEHPYPPKVIYLEGKR